MLNPCIHRIVIISNWLLNLDHNLIIGLVMNHEWRAKILIFYNFMISSRTYYWTLHIRDTSELNYFDSFEFGILTFKVFQTFFAGVRVCCVVMENVLNSSGQFLHRDDALEIRSDLGMSLAHRILTSDLGLIYPPNLISNHFIIMLSTFPKSHHIRCGLL